jgi:hypothetical protein
MTGPDPHAALCERALAALEARFPGAGIGVTGSFAAGRHHAGSDLDLVVVSPSVRRDWQMAFREQGVRVNVLCVHPERFAAQMRADAAAFAAIRASYLLSARAVSDPHGHLAALRDEARAAVALREHGRGELMRRLHRTALDLLARGAGTLDVWAVGALWTAVEGAHLRAGRTALEKGDGNRPFQVLERHDPELHALAHAVFEGAPARETVAEMIARVFGPDSPPIG